MTKFQFDSITGRWLIKRCQIPHFGHFVWEKSDYEYAVSPDPDHQLISNFNRMCCHRKLGKLQNFSLIRQPKVPFRSVARFHILVILYGENRITRVLYLRIRITDRSQIMIECVVTGNLANCKISVRSDYRKYLSEASEEVDRNTHTGRWS